MKISNFIYNERIKRGMTQEQFAKKCLITTPTISHIECGQKPSVRIMVKIASYLEVEPEMLFALCCKDE